MKVDVGDGLSPQNRTAEGWGAFPQDFVDFHEQTGQSSYWYPSGGATDPRKAADPITFAWSPADDAPPTEGGEGEDAGDVDVDVTVPEGSDPTDPTDPSDPQFSVTLSDTSASLGTATKNASGFSVQGALPTITVTDTRTSDNSFTINAQAAAFTGDAGTIPASALGWKPAATGTIAEATVGAAVTANAPGLGDAATLVSAPDGHGAGEVSADAKLSLQAPASTKPGAYSTTITITTIDR